MAIILKNMTMPAPGDRLTLTINSDGTVQTGYLDDMYYEAAEVPEPQKGSEQDDKGAGKIKYTIEATPTSATAMLEFAGDTFMKTWVVDSSGHEQTPDEPFWRQAQRTDRYSPQLLDMLYIMFEHTLNPMNFIKLAENGTEIGKAPKAPKSDTK